MYPGPRWIPVCHHNRHCHYYSTLDSDKRVACKRCAASCTQDAVALKTKSQKPNEDAREIVSLLMRVVNTMGIDQGIHPVLEYPPQGIRHSGIENELWHTL